MKHAIIIHGWGGYPNYCWYPETKKELEEKGFAVSLPELPSTDNPLLNEWLPVIQKLAADPTEKLYLIGHSLGCITILRYLEALHVGQKIGGVVFVSGFGEDLGIGQTKTFFAEPVNFEKIKQSAKEFVIINSDDDPYVDLKYARTLEDKLGAKLIIKHGMKHISGEIGKQESITFLPDVAEEIIRMSQ